MFATHSDFIANGLCQKRFGKSNQIGDRGIQIHRQDDCRHFQEPAKSETFKSSIEQCLREALACVREEDEARVHQAAIRELDVQAIRARAGLSQTEFAESIGVTEATLASWELRRRSPGGPVRVLLARIDKDPKIVQRALAS